MNNIILHPKPHTHTHRRGQFLGSEEIDWVPNIRMSAKVTECCNRPGVFVYLLPLYAYPGKSTLFTSFSLHFYLFFLNINSHVFSNINRILLKYMRELLYGVKVLSLLSGVKFESAVSVRTVPVERVHSWFEVGPSSRPGLFRLRSVLIEFLCGFIVLSTATQRCQRSLP